MRQSCLTAAIGSAFLLLVSPAIARDAFEIQDSLPKTYEDLYKTIKKDLEADEKENISAYLEGAQCGGWNMDESVEGKIATVVNAPGRTGEWDGDIPSGMAVRDDEFSYPPDAMGLSTACDAKKEKISKTYAYGIGFLGEITGAEIIDTETKDINQPYFEDPACLWDATGKIQGPQTPPKCQNSCNWMNTYTYRDCKAKTADIFCFGPENCVDVTVCTEWGDRYTCSDEWVNDTDSQKNCRLCVGEECRCSGTEPACYRIKENKKAYASFYREYGVSYVRDAVTEAAGDATTKAGTIACYGLYDEFDPKTHQTVNKDLRCTVNMNLRDMKESQEGKGEYGEQSDLADPLPEKRNDGKFDPEKDVWYEHLGNAFSLLVSGSIGEVLMNSDKLDKGEQKAAVQLSDDKPLAEHSLTRAFDETAEERVIATWWQEQQTWAQTYVHGPVLRLVLPSTWAIGASTDPFLKKAEVQKEEPEKDGEEKPEAIGERSKSIEVQIRADEDTLGEAIAFIERSLTLQIVEEPVPVVIPLADPVELRATAASWCAWSAAKDNAADCSNAPEKVKKLIESLGTYADKIEEYRSLRAVLANHVAEILKHQNDVTKPLTDWMKTNVSKYKESIVSRKKVAAAVAPVLDTIQALLGKFDNETNMPWCMNQRFTIPIYSLLDPWLPSRSNGGDISDENLPKFPEPEDIPEDIVLDISRITYLQTQVPIPVLKPIQVRLDIPSPPNADAIRELPDIDKEIGKIKTAIQQSRSNLPKVVTKGTPPAITLPEPLKETVITEMKKKAEEMGTIFESMNKTYDDFWKSKGPLVPEAEWTEADKKLAKQKTDLECDWGVFPCLDVEMDLIERITRIASRPLVFLKEDYESKAEKPREDVAECPPEDHVCLLLHPEKTKPVQGWEVRGPALQSVGNFLDTVRTSLMNITFSTPLGSADKDSIPPYDSDDAERAHGILSLPSSPLIPVTKP